MPNLSRAACQLTIMRIMAPDLWNQAPLAGSCYLHTLTFPNPEPSEVEAMKRFNAFTMWARRTGKVFVRVVERGDATGRLHFHLVSSQRWSAREMSKALPRWGFGRYDVRERPIERAFYAAKYVGKRGKVHKLKQGTRTWGACGITPTRARDVEVTKKELVLCGPTISGITDGVVWVVEGVEHVVPFRFDSPSYPLGQYRKMELKKHQTADVLGRLAKGAVGAVGEYRSCTVRSMQVRDKQNPAAKIDRHIVEHNVEVGDAPLLVQEWLPPGADVHQVKPAANKGDAVFVNLTRLDSKFGSQMVGTGVCIPLLALPIA